LGGRQDRVPRESAEATARTQRVDQGRHPISRLHPRRSSSRLEGFIAEAIKDQVRERAVDAGDHLQVTVAAEKLIGIRIRI
jgi:hypothetical protein